METRGVAIITAIRAGALVSEGVRAPLHPRCGCLGLNAVGEGTAPCYASEWRHAAIHRDSKRNRAGEGEAGRAQTSTPLVTERERERDTPLMGQGHREDKRERELS